MANESDSVQTGEDQVQPTEAGGLEKSGIQGEKAAGETPAKSEELKPDAVQKRINKLTAEKYHYRELYKQERLKNQDLTKKPDFPNPKQYEDEFGNVKQKEWNQAIEDYETARDNWKAAQSGVRQEEEEMNRELEEGKIRFSKNAAKFYGKHPDFYEVIQTGGYSEKLANTLITFDNGHELAYYLGKHKDEVERLGKLSPQAMIDELEALEQRMKVQPRLQSGAPPPINPVDDSLGGGAVDFGKLPIEERIRIRRERRYKKLRGQ